MGHVLIEGFVFFLSHVALWAGPQGAGLIDGFFFTRRLHGLGVFVPLFLGHANRQGDVIRIFTQNLAQLPAIKQVFLFGTQMQGDFCTTARMVNVRDRVFTLTRRNPFNAFIGRCARLTAAYGHFIGHNERRIETHAKLANQIGVLLGITRQRREEFFGAGFGNGAQVGNGLFLGHADAVIGNGNGLGFGIQQNAQA